MTAVRQYRSMAEGWRVTIGQIGLCVVQGPGGEIVFGTPERTGPCRVFRSYSQKDRERIVNTGIVLVRGVPRTVTGWEESCSATRPLELRVWYQPAEGKTK